MIKYASLPPLNADCMVAITSEVDNPRSLIFIRSTVTCSSGLLNFRFTSTLEKVLSFRASSKNFGIISFSLFKSWFCKINWIGSEPLDVPPTEMVCSCTANIRASLNRLSLRWRSLAISAWLRLRNFGSIKASLGCEVFMAPLPGVRAKTKSLSGTESYR